MPKKSSTDLDVPEPLRRMGYEQCLMPKEYLFRCGAEVNQLYYLIEGELRALRHQPNGQKAVMMRATTGEFFAAASLLTDGYPCDALAPVQTRVWVMPKSGFLQALSEKVELGQWFALSLAKELKRQCGRVERSRLRAVRDKVMHFITCETSDGHRLTLSTNLQDWADELGVEPESLYRTLKQMELAGELLRTDNRLELIGKPT